MEKRFEIVSKRKLNDNITWLVIKAPLVARKAKPGQFIILRTDEYGERVPLTMAGEHPEDGTIDLIYAAVGRSTMLMDQMEVGDCFADIVGPLGKPTEMEGLKKVCVVGGGTGNALAFPLACGMKDAGVDTYMVEGFKNKDLVILEDRFKEVCNLHITTDDGSYGRSGMVTVALQDLWNEGHKYDHCVAIGPMIMMKFVCKLTKELGIPTVVSMNPIMVDGTGMCGACRLTVGGEVKFACVDGPEFDGHKVDFDQAMNRMKLYKTEEGRLMLKAQEGDTHHGGCGNCD